jgi:hypothetical protein
MAGQWNRVCNAIRFPAEKHGRIAIDDVAIWVNGLLDDERGNCRRARANRDAA